MKTVAILPRGGLGDILYHLLFARHLQNSVPNIEPVLLAPQYAKFLAELLAVRHLPVCSLTTDSTAGLNILGELAFFGAFYKLRGTCLASFTNDIVDHGLARLFRLALFDKGALGNMTLQSNQFVGLLSRGGLNRLLLRQIGGKANPKHIMDRQRLALAHFGLETADLPKCYRNIWLDAMSEMDAGEVDNRLVLLFPETARTERNLTFHQIDSIVRTLRNDYRIRIFTRDAGSYRSLGVENAGFADRLEPLRQIRRAAAVITADTFSGHLAGLCETPTYVIYNFAYNPIWCEYWGSPFSNVLHFEKGTCYRLDEDFQAVPFSEESLFFNSVQQASKHTLSPEGEASKADVLTGSATRY